MTQITWDAVGTKEYETGVDRGVLYIPDGSGAYPNGYGWNGLTGIEEAPTGAEATAKYADNIKYLNLISTENFEGTIKAFMYPDQWAQCDGSKSPQPGVSVGQQTRSSFGLAYRTRNGNDVLGADFGYKIHLVWGALASPSSRAYDTINDTPDAIEFSWKFTTTPVAVSSLKPTALMAIDSTVVTPANLAALETILYGTVGVAPRLPLPDEVIALFAGSVTTVTPTAATYNTGTHTITIPTQTGTIYKRVDTGATVTQGSTIVLTVGQTLGIKETPAAGYVFAANSDDYQLFTY